MDQRERIADPEEGHRAMLDGRQATIWTCLPGIIDSVDLVKMTAVVQSAIQVSLRGTDGVYRPTNLPQCLDCPIEFPSGGGFTLTFPIAPGDECEITFASRCIDAWWQQGGVQPQAEFRMHDLSDGFVKVGPRSQPRVIPNISASTAQLRSDDGAVYVEVAGGHVVNIVAPGGINLVGPVHMTSTCQIDGAVNTNSTITASGEVSANGSHTLSAHRHGGVAAGAAQTAPPTG